MCTLSIFTLPNQTIITMNRDEVRDRYEANIIQHAHTIASQSFYPVDKQSSGTWFGFNGHGIVLALLNGYHETQLKDAKSRGFIIPYLLKFNSLQQVEEQMAEQIADSTERNYNPFDLIYADTSQIIKFNWNGKKLSKQKIANPQAYMFSSSSVDTANILAKRADIFSDFKNNMPAANKPAYILQQLHLKQDSTDTSSSIFMTRAKTHTKSISQIIIKNKELDYYYIDETQIENTIHTKLYSQCHHQALKLNS